MRRRSGVKVVAITGSAGKTSTKDILAALLRPVARTVATTANLNNEIGVPLTLLQIEPDTEVVVVEMAMRGRGQIRELARVALPDVGVITTIAPVHLELVGTVEDVAAAKAELIEELGGGTAVVPADEPLLDPHVGRFRGRVVTFGAPDADVHLVDEERRGDGTHVLVDAFGHRAHARLQLHRRPLPAGRAGRAGRLRRAGLPRSTRPETAPPRSPSATCAAPSRALRRRRPAAQRRLQRQPAGHDAPPSTIS